MKIHLISDLHRESGPYALPPDLECDVIVAAGDIGVGADGVEWLKTLDKPVVYVLGNHEYWSPSTTERAQEAKQSDMFDVIDAVRAVAVGSNVHFLENESVVIDGVRFLGATMWTNLGYLNPRLLRTARKVMNDYNYMSCARFYADADYLDQFWKAAEKCRKAVGSTLREHGYGASISTEYLQEEVVNHGKFHPLVSYVLHQRTVKWIEDQIKGSSGDYYNGKTVVVTHHHPSYESLQRIGVNENYLSIGTAEEGYSRWNAIRDEDLYYVAAYASELFLINWIDPSPEFARHREWENPHLPPMTPCINAWLCGHIHHHLDYMEDGMRVACNPRGRYYGSAGQETADAYKNAEALPRKNRNFGNPYRGDGIQFDPRFVIDLDQRLIPVIATETKAVIPELTQLFDEIFGFSQHASMADKFIKIAIEESIMPRAQRFQEIVRKLVKNIQINLGSCPLEFDLASLSFSGRYSPFGEFTSKLQTPKPDQKLKIEALLKAQKNTLDRLTTLTDVLPKITYNYTGIPFQRTDSKGLWNSLAT